MPLSTRSPSMNRRRLRSGRVRWLGWVCLIGLVGCGGGAIIAPGQPTGTHPEIKMTTATVPSARSISTPVRSSPFLPATPGLVIIGANDYFFYPNVLTLTVGSTVRWENRGAEMHDVTMNAPGWNTPYLSSGDTYDFTFKTEGVYDYTCAIHSPDMRGTLVVIGK